MGKTITVASPLLTSIQSVQLTPAQRAAVWEIAAVLDERHVPAEQDDAVWIEVATARLRGEDARNDNVWLRELLDRLTGAKLGGTWRGDRWGGVLLAEWRIERGGSTVQLLLPPSGVRAIRSPETFAKIDAEAVHRLPPHARTLYGLLADRQRQNKPEWTPDLDELKTLLGVGDKYNQWHDFQKRVLKPAVKAIRDFGVVNVNYEPVKLGRAVQSVRFRWDLKDPHSATSTAIENQRHSEARGKHDAQPPSDASPLAPGNKPGDGGDEQIDLDDQSRALMWWDALPMDTRAPLTRRHDPDGSLSRAETAERAWRAAGKPWPGEGTGWGV